MSLHIVQACLERKRLPRPRAGKAPESPAEFDLAHFPIISRHWFGIDPEPINGGAAARIADPRLPVELLAKVASEMGKRLRRQHELEPAA